MVPVLTPSIFRASHLGRPTMTKCKQKTRRARQQFNGANIYHFGAERSCSVRASCLRGPLPRRQASKVHNRQKQKDL